MFKLEIDTGGAAFRDEDLSDENGNYKLDPNACEVKRLLLLIRDEISEGYTSGKVWDINGNHAGNWNYEEDAK